MSEEITVVPGDTVGLTIPPSRGRSGECTGGADHAERSRNALDVNCAPRAALSSPSISIAGADSESERDSLGSGGEYLWPVQMRPTKGAGEQARAGDDAAVRRKQTSSFPSSTDARGAILKAPPSDLPLETVTISMRPCGAPGNRRSDTCCPRYPNSWSRAE